MDMTIAATDEMTGTLADASEQELWTTPVVDEQSACAEICAYVYTAPTPV
ncbi:MAG: hypothetical protein Q8Q09_21330 [Deltaproteobacteria bacterium]|nr:hypothetical protein [Deltaproteobacteria bacterium]